ncbi:hypothetical protein V6N11_002789 [Hibiscus sabdariffa]|uniref:Protein FAR1-RELATED SEQUENCE n=1 Tax=Hibiscus sabdariffa TaxID=183260 RepID=A0ABR2SBA7_9ROSI
MDFERSVLESILLMEEVSLNTDPVVDDDADEFEIEGDCGMAECVSQSGVIQGENPLPPVVGMEFDSVSNTWYRKSKERYRGKLSCSSAGFKKKSEANRPRPETRTGCPAMIKFRLMDNKRWRIIEVELDHNHLISPVSGKFYKSHKQLVIGTKRALQIDSAEEVQNFRLFRTVVVDVEGNGSAEVIITDQCKTLQTAIADVFPRASHCLCLPRIMQKVQEKLGELYEYESIRMALHNAVYYSLRPEEFEATWEDMIHRYGIRDHIWLQMLYEDRRRWVPVYLKEIFLAGMIPIGPNEVVESFFGGNLDRHTSLKEFLDKYDQTLQANHQLEVLADMESRNSGFMLKSRCYFELQLAKLYTNNILRKFEREVEGMYSCFSTRQINGQGQVITYMVGEQSEVDGNRRETKDFEVLYNATEMEVLCACGLFNFKGYLCRHVLSILHQNGIEEIPPQYILSRWRKDINRSYVLNHDHSGIDVNNPVHRYDHLYKCIMQVVEEGRKSEDRYKETVQALDQILSKLNLVEGRL